MAVRLLRLGAGAGCVPIQILKQQTLARGIIIICTFVWSHLDATVPLVNDWLAKSIK